MTEPMRLPALALLALLAFAPAASATDAADAASTPPATPPDLAALIECRADYPALLGLVPVLTQPLEAVALGWRPQAQTNPFMLEYRLNTPITVFGRSTDHIAFAGEAVMAVLDLAEPRVLARELELETGIDTPKKALFGREVRATELAPGEDGVVWIESVILNVSNVDSHPGKTLAGCSYGRGPLDDSTQEQEEPAAPAAPAPQAAASPATAVTR